MNLYEVLPDVERFRKESLVALKKELSNLKKEAEETLKLKVYSVKPIGSVLDANRFNQDSDIDVGIYLTADASEVDEELSSKLQDILVSHPIHPFGVVNCVVFK